MDPKWLEWAKQIQAIAQTGLAYTKDVYDAERFEALRAISIDILAHHTLEDREKVRLSFAADTGYATPKVDVRGVVFREGKILLVRERIDGAWSLPGGWADIGYSPTEVAVKEVKEESGFDVQPAGLLAVLDKKFHHHPPSVHHVYKIFIRCEIVGGEALSGVETSDVGFFGEHELPELSVGRNTEAQIQTMFGFLKQPDKTVIID
jgi:ADP-ribose pyrophosphatase YjhB (NUDIX family)